MIEAALDYHRRGFALVPLQPRGKKPASRVLEHVHGDRSWKPLATRPATPEQIRAWFAQEPGINLGIIAVNGLAVVDVDYPDRFDVTHPPTPAVKTRRGWHLYMRADGPIVKRHPWGEALSNGHIVVAPPSVIDGSEYRWAITLDEAAMEPIPASLLTADNGPHTATDSKPVVLSEKDMSPDDAEIASILAYLGRSNARPRNGSTRRFSCVLPWHADRNPSANLFRGRTGRWVYHCHGCGATLGLAALYATLLNNQGHLRRGIVPLNAPAAARWHMRLRVDAGMLTAPTSRTVRLPERCSPTALTLAEGFLQLERIRAMRDPDAPGTPYGREFAAIWCAIGTTRARAGLAELRARFGWLEVAGRSHGLELLRVADEWCEDRLPPEMTPAAGGRPGREPAGAIVVEGLAGLRAAPGLIEIATERRDHAGVEAAQADTSGLSPVDGSATALHRAPPLLASPARHVERSPHCSNVIAHNHEITPLSGVVPLAVSKSAAPRHSRGIPADLDPSATPGGPHDHRADRHHHNRTPCSLSCTAAPTSRSTTGPTPSTRATVRRSTRAIGRRSLWPSAAALACRPTRGSGVTSSAASGHEHGHEHPAAAR
jgi:hypothetical protein